MAENNDRHIQWYPGHMARSTREIKEQLRRVDLLVEVADARIPLSSRNPSAHRFISEKRTFINTIPR